MNKTRCPNLFPHNPRSPRVAIIGEAPGKRELELGRPFCGPTGYFLFDGDSSFPGLSSFNLHRDEVFLGNVCQELLPGEVILKLWNSDRIQKDLDILFDDLSKFNPSFIISMGNVPLRLFSDDPKRKIGKWKNSLDTTNFLGHPIKVLYTLHPASCLHEDSNRFFFYFQAQRMAEEAETAKLVLPEREILIHDDFKSAIKALKSLHNKRLAFDIEGNGRSGMTCFGLAESPTKAHVFPLISKRGPLFTAEEQDKIVDGLRDLIASLAYPEPFVELGSPDHIAKALKKAAWMKKRKGLILHNTTYDAFCLCYKYDLNILPAVVDDTMILWWELFAETEKDLASCASIATREPNWKAEREADDDLTEWRYNGKDCCITFEVCDWLYDRPELDSGQLWHYCFNMGLLAPILYIQLRGINMDKEERTRLLKKAEKEVAHRQVILDLRTGQPPTPKTWEELLDLIKPLCVKRPRVYHEEKHIFKSGKRKGETITKKIGTDTEIKSLDDAISFTLSGNEESISSIKRILKRAVAAKDRTNLPTTGPLPSLTIQQEGEIRRHLNIHFNTNSPQANEYLYNYKNYPPQYKKGAFRSKQTLTHDADALLHLYGWARKNGNREAEKLLRNWLKLSKALTAIETLRNKPDVDGRMRFSLNLVGTGTGRLSCSALKYEIGIGYNLQTETKKHRHTYIADPGCDIAEFDLEGADAWTVALWCAKLGDPNLLEDMKAGVKPAWIIALGRRHGPDIFSLSRKELLERAKEVNDDDWDYRASKMVIYGSCYLMGLLTMQTQLTHGAWSKSGELVWVPYARNKELQQLVFLRYPGIKKWQEYVKDEVWKNGSLRVPSGHVRRFFGRRDEWKVDSFSGSKQRVFSRSMHGTALSDEPQENTTFATKMGLWRMWYSKENRR